MAAPKRAPVTAHDLQGFKYFRLLGPLLDQLHAAGTAQDRAGNRQLFYDQYATLLLLYFFSPLVTSLRGLPLTLIREGRRRRYHLTPLSRVQRRILALLGFPEDIYTSLCPDSHKPP
ncbi:MAG: hypothetical protein ACREOH_05275 [Candidatus Entotheonellia bacterium]|jgi:hypothetical protein